MQEKYKRDVKRMQLIQLVLAVACIIAFISFYYYINRPKIIMYNYLDECGPMPGGSGISHTMKNEDTCSNACYSYCLTKEMSLDKVEFKVREGPECNQCSCYCKG